MNIVFRCDASIKIGMGHVVRCLALAKKLQSLEKCKIYFAMRDSNICINLVQQKYPIIKDKISNLSNRKWIMSILKKTNADVLILDVRDDLKKEDIIHLKKINNLKVVTIDDNEDKRLETDLALYPPVPQLDKMKWSGYKGELCVGWEYAIVREEFSKEFLKPVNVIPEVFVSMGATDEKNMTQSVIRSLAMIKTPLRINIVLGSGYSHLSALNNEINKHKLNYKIYKNPSNIFDIMIKSDFAIISFGVTAYELASLGIPSFYISLSDDHLESSRLFVVNGLGFSIGIFSPKIIPEIREQVSLYLSNYSEKDFDYSNRNFKISNLDKMAKKILNL